MPFKKVHRKVQIATNLLKDEGILAVGIRSLEFIQKKQRSRGQSTSQQKHNINTRAIYSEILSANPSVSANEKWMGMPVKKHLTFNWLMPPPGKGSGGHMTLYRFISYLEAAGHTCRIYLHNPGPYSTVEAVRSIMGDSFPLLKAEMEWLKQGEEMKPADGIFATSWETAYTVYSSKVNAKKFYFVQDFEPFFYPVGSFSVLAENTYRLGLRGITAGGWLAKKLSSEYSMTTDAFSFGSDSDVYTFSNNSNRKEIVFYARPTTERRAFELGILTLDLFHRKHPEYIINFIGWDVSEYNIPFPHKNLGILDPIELNELYNRSSVSLVMSLTNMSLLPLELLSSGCIPIVNEGPNNTLVSENSFIAYAKTNPISLSEKLSEIVEKKNLTTYAKQASDSVQNLSWDESGKQLVKVIEKATRSPGEK
jgi:glycosyltransferase involved in cell wall biosynthesis